MPPVNGYTLLQYIKDQKKIVSVNATEDLFIDRAIGAASRLFEGAVGGRTFYPRITTLRYDYPDGLLLFLDDDLLELTTLTNGDGVVLTNADYILMDPNQTPYWGVKIKDTSSEFWQLDANGSAEQIIQVNGVWGFRQDYARGWVLADTLGAAIVSTSTLSLTTTGSGLLIPGQIIRIDSEVMIVNTVVTTATTVLRRGENGSTAATHLIAAPIYVWQPQDDVRAAVEDIVMTAYNKRFGIGMEAGAAVTVTAAGVVLTPKDITDYAKTVAAHYRRVF